MTHSAKPWPQPSDRAKGQTPQSRRKEWEAARKGRRRPGISIEKHIIVLTGRTARLNASPGNSKCSFAFQSLFQNLFQEPLPIN